MDLYEERVKLLCSGEQLTSRLFVPYDLVVLFGHCSMQCCGFVNSLSVFRVKKQSREHYESKNSRNSWFCRPVIRFTTGYKLKIKMDEGYQ